MKRRNILKLLSQAIPLAGGLLASSASSGRESAQSSSSQKCVVRSRIKSLKYPEKPYQSIEEFWEDHEQPKEQIAITSFLSLFGNRGDRKCLFFDTRDLSAVYETTYQSQERFFKHLQAINNLAGIPSRQEGQFYISQLSEDLLVIDEIQNA